MKYTTALLGFCLLLPLAAGASFFEDDAPNPCVLGNGATFEPEFSSDDGALSPGIVRAVAAAKKTIRVSARDFMSKPVSEALVKAQHAGVDVKVVLNKKGTTNIDSAASFLRTMSLVPHLTKSDDGLYSNYIVVDERDVIVGNIARFVDDDEEKKGAASVLIIHNAPDAAKRYAANWQKLWDASEPMPEDKRQ